MPTADLTISMDDGTTTVAPGAATSYTIVVSNNGPDAVTGATVFDSLPDGITGNSWLATGSVVPGTSDTYTITVTNNGPSTVSSLTLSDTIPAALLNRNFAPSVGAYDAATGAWSGLSLASGQHVTLTLTGTIASNATGTITNTVTVAPPAGTTDTDPFNGTATDTDTLPPKLTTAASPDVTLSGSVVTLRDSATLSDGSNPTGTITFTLIAPGGLTVDTETVAVNGDGTYTTPTGFTLPTAGTVAGTYSWNATYSGDPNNNPANASPEPTVVSRASPGLSTTASPGGVAGTTLTDIAHLSGGYFPSGTITFMLTATSGLTVDTETVTANGNGTYATPTGFTLPTGTVPGTYVWHVLYNGDGNNNTVAANLENVTVGVNPFPPPGTTADMILRASNTSLIAGQYEIYDIGNNAILAASVLGQVGTDFQFAGLGSFFGSDTTDMLLRSATTGAFEVYDISNNNITNAAALGTVGLNFQVAGFGDFNRDGATDMVLRSSTTGQFELYNIRNNAITSASNLGTVGLNFQVAGFGNFNGDGSTDMMLRNVNTGQFELYDIVNNQITSAFNIGTVGLDFQVAGFADFNGDGSTDMMLRNRNTGQFELYDIVNNQITSAFNIGTVGLDFQVAGFGAFHAPGASDMILRNANTGQFEVYDIVNNQITTANSLGAVGLNFQVGGFAANPATASTGGAGSTAQLVQAMAAFGGGDGAADGLNIAPLGADNNDYTVTVTNNGPDTVTQFNLNFAPGAGLTWAGTINPVAFGSVGTLDPVGDVNSWLWSGLSLASGQSAFATFIYSIDPNATGPLTVTSTVIAPAGTTDPTPINDSFTDSDTVTPQSDLAVAIDDGTTIVVPGTSNTYTITVTNNGPSTVSSLTLTDSIPAALLNPNFTPSAGAYISTQVGPNTYTGVWSGLSLASGQSVTLTLTGTIDPNATGLLTNIVTVAPPAGTTDTNSANDTATDTDTIPVATTLATTASPNVTLSNSSVTLSDSATLNPTGNIVFTLSGPGGFSFTETDTVNGDGTYDASLTLPTTGTVVGTYSWTAIYTPGDANNLGSSAPTEQTVVSPVTPSLASAASPSGAFAGSTLTDVATLTGGYFPTGSIVFTLTGPNGFSFTQTDAVSSGNGTYSAATTLDPSGTIPGTYLWTAQYLPGDGNNNAVVAAQIVTVGGPQADLAVTVDDGKTTVTPGSSNTYTITVTNNGPSMVDALVTDSFPADFTNVSWFVLLNPGAISASPPGSFGQGATTAAAGSGAG